MWFGHQSNPRTAWGWSLKIYFLKIFRSVRESQGTHGEKKTNSPTVWVSRNVLFLVCIFFYITAVLFEWIRAVIMLLVLSWYLDVLRRFGGVYFLFIFISLFLCKMTTGLAKSSKVIFYAWKSFDIYFSISISEWKMKRNVCYYFKIFRNYSTTTTLY